MSERQNEARPQPFLAQLIRAMSDEKLAELLAFVTAEKARRNPYAGRPYVGPSYVEPEGTGPFGF